MHGANVVSCSVPSRALTLQTHRFMVNPACCVPAVTCAVLWCVPLLSSSPAQVISVDAMDAAADWPTKIEELRFDPQDVSDPTWHRCVVLVL